MFYIELEVAIVQVALATNVVSYIPVRRLSQVWDILKTLKQ